MVFNVKNTTKTNFNFKHEPVSTRAWKPTFIHTIGEDAVRGEVTDVQGALRRQLHRSQRKAIAKSEEFLLRERLKMTLENGSNYRKALKIIKIHNKLALFVSDPNCQGTKIHLWFGFFVFLFFSFF
uniref:Uncharacterized protein n=1 Tax=Micrurus spixii TaxID=129469 RepID=A0A2D4LDV2_9SAUR